MKLRALCVVEALLRSDIIGIETCLTSAVLGPLSALASRYAMVIVLRERESVCVLLMLLWLCVQWLCDTGS